MLIARTYYRLKPLLPLSLRVALRRWRAWVKRRAFADSWPIDPKAGAAPPNWPGWPGGKRFAFALTHDVEGTRGVARIPRLMELDARYGFRAAFNLVPEGEYRVPRALVEEMQQAGFETGVHGLEHDGKLYSSRAIFSLKARSINHYLEEWGACGFRSPLMQHELSWLHELRLTYDSSTFDTDPFEPQPDGAGTIFPFWVDGPEGAGYVEMPYTLVQDFTLFVILQERNTEIWKKKLDWIAEHGGMALVNIHPDYVSFDNRPSPYEYPVTHLEEFLEYVRSRYAGEFWHALPREVAHYYRAAMGMVRPEPGIAREEPPAQPDHGPMRRAG